MDKYLSFPKGVSLLKVQEKIATTPRFLEMNPITIHILKPHEPGYLDKYILFPKGISLLKAFRKVQEKSSKHP